MPKFNVKKFAVEAILPAAVINAAGFLEPRIDAMVNSKVAFLSSAAVAGPVTYTPPFSSTPITYQAVANSGGTKGATNAKAYKALLYTGIGLAAQAAVEVIDGKGKKGEMASIIGDAIGLFAYGLSGATIAEDPVLNVPSRSYAIAGNPQGAPMARQVVSKSGNFIS